MKEDKLSKGFFEIEELDLKTLEVIFDYLSEFPNQLTRKKTDNNKKISIEFQDNAEMRSWVIKKYLNSKKQKPYSKERTTVPDELVSLILEKLYKYDVAERDKIKQSYIDQKQVEQKIIGYMLQKYIAKEGFDYGYYDVAGEILRTIDIIKKDENGKWVTLQIKNSDNTKNSTVAAGTRSGIKNWVRRKSRTGETNWDVFPDKELGSQLSEEGFKNYIWEYFDLSDKNN